MQHAIAVKCLCNHLILADTAALHHSNYNYTAYEQSQKENLLFSTAESADSQGSCEWSKIYDTSNSLCYLGVTVTLSVLNG